MSAMGMAPVRFLSKRLKFCKREAGLTLAPVTRGRDQQDAEETL